MLVSLTGESAWVQKVDTHAFFLDAKLISKLVLFLLFVCASIAIPVLESKRQKDFVYYISDAKND